jgi:hypothetical protein
MPSLADIPVHLRNPDAKPSFLAWLKGLPVSSNAKRALASLWRQHNRSSFDLADYIQAGITSPR